MSNWNELKWFGSGEEQVVLERLDDLKRSGVVVNPDPKQLYAAMDVCPLDSVRVAIIGQDPYPNHRYCTGVAFSIPRNVPDHPPTLKNILNEWAKDIHQQYPKSGNLEKWCSKGVFLWNAIPSTNDGVSLAHAYWDEYYILTGEIIKELNERACVIVFLGSFAFNHFGANIDDRSVVLKYGHPSPRGDQNSKNPFTGSRMFTTINSHLADPIDWRLE